MAGVLVSTVWHTGTRSLIRTLGGPCYEIKRLHCSTEAVRHAQYYEYDRVVTTYRDPLETAKSWARRAPHWRYDKWRYQWDCYLKILPFAEVIKIEDLDCTVGDDDDKPYNGTPPASEVDYVYKLLEESKWLQL